MATNDAALRKRQQISKANQMMFIWVIVASIALGIAAVVSVFLVQRLIFNEKVLAEKQNTVGALERSKQAVDPLAENVQVLNTNQALLDSRAREEDKPLQAIIDALPDTANSAALGSSLQNVLIPGRDVTLDTLTVDPMTEESEDGVLTFTFTVSAPQDRSESLKALLRRLEKSIRAIDVTALTFETNNNNTTMSVTGKAYYEPAKTVQLGTKQVQP